MPTQVRSQSIGKRLKKLRQQKKITLKQLANDTGLAADYISRLEKGEIMPPVSVLLQLSKAFEIDSSLLFKEEKTEAEKQKDEDHKKRTESYVYETLTPDAKNKFLKAFRVFVDPLSEHKGVSYQHPGEEFVYVLQGSIEVLVGENRNVLGPHEALHFNSGIVHRLRNLGAERAELLVVLYAP